ncbi:hypothetical protein JCM30471_25530 [Desulfuromonas carbonis]|uniref:sulfurtransferase n=1 Tax=Desulfuromonas sp. DDH964 TaxID=1823759 RepID=UPI00078BF3A7|nr:rhodanese-like domain-containing protein [Desulfuromonas sp. DDH964]AMV70559.1 iron-sulfur cluster-binding oxidoreductase [Desulfuromonas sp. DDH964]
MKRFQIPILVGLLIITLSLLVGCGSSSDVKTAANAQPAAITTLSDSFVTTDFVAAVQQGSVNEKVVLIDTRSAAEYAAGHIEGAINVQHGDYIRTRTVAGATSDVKYLIVNEQEFVDLVNSLGITPDTTVVVYDNDISFGWAPRLAWTLQYYGHARAFSVDGGIQKWQLIDGRPLVTTPTLPTPNTTSYVISGQRSILASKEELSAAVGNSSFVVLDARVPGEYAGVTNATWDAYRLGHIPGAIFIDWADVLKDNAAGVWLADGSRPVKVLKSETELRNYFAARGVTADTTIIAHCEGGIRSSFITQVLLGLGYTVKNYDGSWNDWGKQTDGTAFPVENTTATLEALRDPTAAISDYFASTDELATELAANPATTKIIDIRSAALYAAGHIPGAINVSANALTVDRADGVQRLLPSQAEFIALANSLGIVDGDRVIVYDADSSSSAARVAWSFVYYGHDARALDGGYKKWTGESKSTETTVNTPVATSSFTIVGNDGSLALAADVLAAISDPAAVINDTRQATEYLQSVPRTDGLNPGHVPGAIWLEWSDLLTYDAATGAKVLKDADSLFYQFLAAGITPDKRVITYCQSGYRSGFSALVLKSLGYPEVQNYDGSWREWGKYNITDPTNFPVE